MRYYKFLNLFTCMLLMVIIGCTTPFMKSKKVIKGDDVEVVEEKADETVDKAVNETTEQVQVHQDKTSPYEEEEALLQQIFDNYDEAVAAYQGGNFGLAETKIEKAFMLFGPVNLTLIEDETLVARFEEALTMLGQEFGKILSESAIIAEEDPMAWIEEIDAEQFRSGKWTDEELKKIVLKIAVKCDVPIEYNKKVRNAIYYFQNGGKKAMVKWLQRSGRYLPMIREILEEEGVPLDMAYLSMIESGFNPRAYSRQRAVGLWQFIYSTGKIYGLKRNEWIDERKDPVKSTKAAAKHLNDLYEKTDDWNNVMAAYNCGARRITRQLKKTENLEYWDMQLPRETRNYVPSFMAAVIIAKAPEIFGFDNVERDAPLEFDTVEVHPYTSLKTIAKCGGYDIEALKNLNPELLKGRIPPGKDMYQLKIPKATKETFLAEYAKVPVEKYQPPRVTSIRVRHGDTFSTIARRNHVSIRSLRAANPQIRNINKLRIGQRIYLPGYGVAETNSASTALNYSSGDTFKYTVRKNDTLGTIAEKYKTNIRTLQALNNMGRRTRIYAGKKILVPVANSSKKEKIAKARSGRITYVVQKNDTIYEIGKKYGVNYRKIMEINNIRNHRRIQPGQVLIIQE